MTMSSSARLAPLGRFALVGFAAWALATAALRLAPGRAFEVTPPAGAAAILAALIILAGLARLILSNVDPASRVAAMIAFVLPGMIGDSVTTALYGVVFPNLPSGAGVFGGLMLLAYSVMLAVSLAMTSGRLTP
jgi:hypothetical protein